MFNYKVLTWIVRWLFSHHIFCVSLSRAFVASQKQHVSNYSRHIFSRPPNCPRFNPHTCCSWRENECHLFRNRITVLILIYHVRGTAFFRGLNNISRPSKKCTYNNINGTLNMLISEFCSGRKFCHTQKWRNVW